MYYSTGLISFSAFGLFWCWSKVLSVWITASSSDVVYRHRLSSNSPSPHLEAVVRSMVAMAVARQLKWLYNQLKVLTVSRILYILINLSSNRPWRKARPNDSSWWCLFFFFLLQPPRVTLPAVVCSCSSRWKKPPSFPAVVSSVLQPLTWAMQHRKCAKLPPLLWPPDLPEAELAAWHGLMWVLPLWWVQAIRDLFVEGSSQQAVLLPLPGHSPWVVGAGSNMLEVTLYPNSLGFRAVKQWLIVSTTSSRMPEKEKETWNFLWPADTWVW